VNGGRNETPKLIEGGLAVDDRGQLSFVNDFSFAGVRRFYLVSNHVTGFVRAWHAHRNEAKFVFVSNGAAVIGAVQIDDWEKPSRTAQVHRFVLSAKKPAILYIPAGYANGFKSLTGDTAIMFFSTASMEEAKNDDVRYDPRYWDIWSIVER
jgi:dTDP-4-dehydrorhamnose 3,5-epimerase